MAATVTGIHLGPDTHANRPAANAVPVGAQYQCSDHDLLYITDGATWTTYLDYLTPTHTALPDAHHAQSHDHSAAGDSTSLSPATLILPVSASPAPTVEGSAVWDSALDLLAVGDGATTKLVYPQLSGTWSPILAWSVSDGDFAYATSTASGVWRRIGSLVFATVELVTSSFTHSTANGNLRVTGLPFAASGNQHRGSVEAGGWTSTNVRDITSVLDNGQTYMYFKYSGSGFSPAGMNQGVFLTGASVILRGTVVYIV